VYQGDPVAEFGEPFVERIEFKGAALYPVQFAAIYDPCRYALIEATTKAGKTAGCLVWLMDEAAHGKPGWNYWWVAPVYPVAMVAFRRMIAGMPPGMFEKNESELRIDLPNGTHIFFKSGEKPDNLYGEDVFAVVLDEASRMREEAFIAVRTTLTKTRGRMRIIGNVKGRRNWFYKMCRKAQSGDMPSAAYHKITWKDAVAAKILDQEEIDDARRVLPEQAFKQLYEADPADDEGNPFGIDAIAACRIRALSQYPTASWGWDLARKVDWTVGVALDRQGDMTNFQRFQKPWREVKFKIVGDSNGKPALVDDTGVGDPILGDLQSAPGGNFTGYTFTPKTKQALMERLVVAIQHKEIGLTGEVLINELESFEYEYTAHGVRYSAPEGMHDDCVCALALAVFGLGGRGQPFVSSPVRGKLGDLDAQTVPDIEDGFGRVRPGWEDRGGMMQ
jgi:hypothetical protein